MSIERVRKTRVEKPKRYEIYHTELGPEFLIADTKSEAVEAKKMLERLHGGQAKILDLKSRE